MYKGRKRRLRAKAEGTLTFEGQREKKEPVYEAKDRSRWPKASKSWERDWAGRRVSCPTVRGSRRSVSLEC